MLTNKRLTGHIDWPLVWAILLLSVIGIVNLYSATYHIESYELSPLFVSQLLRFLVGIFFFFLFLFVDYKHFYRSAYPLHFFVCLLLVMVVFMGKEVSGNKNWLVLGPLSIQPSEIAKLSFVIALSRYFVTHPSRDGYDLREVIRPILILLSALIPILLGKDLGTGLFMILTFGTLILFAGVRRNIIVLSLVLALIGGGMAYKYFLSENQKGRIESFMNPDLDPKGKGYHIIQSKIAVGSGQMLGKGYLKGTHNKLKYLPERHTDFIFPVLAEEWGFMGGMCVLSLFFLLLFFGIQISARAKDPFGSYLAVSIVMTLFWQVAINLGGVLGLMPLTGVTLPFLSYGGSSLITTFVGMGLLANISARRFMF